MKNRQRLFSLGTKGLSPLLFRIFLRRKKMNAEVLVQNVFNLFVVAVILEAAVMAIFSITALKKMEDNSVINTVRDVAILVLSAFICYNVRKLNLFSGTGLKLPELVDVLISALFLARMTILVQNIFSKIKLGSD
jgi:hypothetical protein